MVSWISLTTVTVLVGTAFWICHSIIQATIRARQYKFPNRVPGLPFLGNTLQFPSGNAPQALWAQEKARKYGEMFTIKLGANDWVFLNSSRVVSDLMEKRAAKYSSRPEFPLAQGLMSGNCRVVLMPYGEKWRQVRKHMHAILNTRKMELFAGFQELESKQLLWDYYKEPDLWYRANQRYANAVIMSVVYGKRLLLGDPNLTPLLEQFEAVIRNLRPGASLVDMWPQLARLPTFLQWWRPTGERLFNFSLKVYTVEVERILLLMKQGKAPDCFAVDFFKATEDSDMSITQKTFVMGNLLEGGSDTSRVSISQIIAAAVTYPEWVVRARQHLDLVCGSNADRLPTWKDKPALRYITAVTKEGFRWRPFLPVGAPHKLTEDDEYEGYKFPAGTLFTWNAYHLSQSSNEYEQPERFWPERWLNDDLDNVLKGIWAFGPGRRVCAGYNVGQTNVWMAIARLLYCFDFKAVPGASIDTHRTDWLVHDKAPFSVKITVRSPAHQRLIEQECSSMSEVQY